LPGLVRAAIDRQALHEALEDIWRIIRAADGYIDAQAPWSLRKTDIVRMGHVLRVLADIIRIVAVVLQPFMPATMARLLDQLGIPAVSRDIASLDRNLLDGSILPSPQGVFPRWVEETDVAR